jgi:hypothetical protein
VGFVRGFLWCGGGCVVVVCVGFGGGGVLGVCVGVCGGVGGWVFGLVGWGGWWG